MTAACTQLQLPFPPTVSPHLTASAGELWELNAALRALLDVADGRCGSTEDRAVRVRHALGVLAGAGVGGRLGHVVRRFAGEAATAAWWDELATELAFATSLFSDAQR